MYIHKYLLEVYLFIFFLVMMPWAPSELQDHPLRKDQMTPLGHQEWTKKKPKSEICWFGCITVHTRIA